MKVKINETLKGVDGIELLKNDKGRPLTLKDVCTNSVLTPNETDDEKKKFEKWELFKKVRDAKDELTLTVEEVVEMKKAIGRIQPPLIMGQCFELLEK